MTGRDEVPAPDGTLDTLLLCGGIGGAKLASGMARVLPPDRLAVLTNTGDDFVHLGLTICPDLDTVLYTLAGVADRDRGWGRADETWRCMEAVGELGGETWFNLGDRDLATHLLRTAALRQGESLSAVTATLAGRLGVRQFIWPMSDQPVATLVETPDQTLTFQEYFVRLRCEPPVSRITFAGAGEAELNPAARAALERDAPPLVVVAPSNPYLSIDPILSVRDLRALLCRSGTTVVVVSPIVAGRAIKGPTAKIMGELGLDPSTVSIARHYREFADYLVVDEADAAEAGAIRDHGIEPLIMPTVMRDEADRDRLARSILEAVAHRV